MRSTQYSPVFIRSAIVFTILFVVAMTALIWYRWSPVALPTSSMIFVGDPSLEGAVVTLTQYGKETLSVTITRQDGYIATVWVTPGPYEIVVTQDDRLVQRTNIVIRAMQSVTDSLSVPLPGKPGATRPATAPARNSS